jgi:hypothetical protein
MHYALSLAADEQFVIYRPIVPVHSREEMEERIEAIAHFAHGMGTHRVLFDFTDFYISGNSQYFYFLLQVGRTIRRFKLRIAWLASAGAPQHSIESSHAAVDLFNMYGQTTQSFLDRDEAVSWLTTADS